MTLPLKWTLSQHAPGRKAVLLEDEGQPRHSKHQMMRRNDDDIDACSRMSRARQHGTDAFFSRGWLVNDHDSCKKMHI